MADAPRQEPLDERFARHLRQERYRQIQDTGDETVAFSSTIDPEPQSIPGNGLSQGAPLTFASPSQDDEPEFYDTHQIARPPQAAMVLPYSGIYLARITVNWADGAGERKAALFSVAEPDGPWAATGGIGITDSAAELTTWDWVYLSEGYLVLNASHDEITDLNVDNARVKLILLGGLELSWTGIG
jgi:hypothetical protein